MLWGTTGVAVAYLGDLTSLTPTAIGFYRLLISAAALLAFAVVVRRVGALVRIARAGPGRVLLTGVGLAPIRRCTSSRSPPPGSAWPPWSASASRPWSPPPGRRPSRRVRPARGPWRSITAALLGLTLISTAGPAGTGSRPLLGLLAAIGSGAVYAVSTLLSRDLSQRTDALTLTTTTSVVGALALLPIAVVQGLAFPVRADLRGARLHRGDHHRGRVRPVLCGSADRARQCRRGGDLLEPLTAALLAVALLAEPLPAPTIAGGALLLAAVAALYLRPRSPEPRRSSATTGPYRRSPERRDPARIS